MSDDLAMQSSRVVVALLDPDAAPELALHRARAESASGREVVYLGPSDPHATAWAVRAEDAARVLVVGDDSSAARLREALDAMELHDVEISRVAAG